MTQVRVLHGCDNCQLLDETEAVFVDMTCIAAEHREPPQVKTFSNGRCKRRCTHCCIQVSCEAVKSLTHILQLVQIQLQRQQRPGMHPAAAAAAVGTFAVVALDPGKLYQHRQCAAPR